MHRFDRRPTAHTLPLACRRLCVAIAVICVCLIGPWMSEANASSNPGGGLGDIVIAVVVTGLLELAVPDVWVEVDHDDQEIRGDLGWPFVFTLGRVGKFDGDDPVVAFARVSAEPHIDTQGGHARGVFTGRIDALIPLNPYGFGLALEGGYQVGEDGSGPIAGGGLIVSGAGFVNLILMYRGAFVGPLQHRATLQLEVPLPVHWLYQDTDF